MNKMLKWVVGLIMPGKICKQEGHDWIKTDRLTVFRGDVLKATPIPYDERKSLCGLDHYVFDTSLKICKCCKQIDWVNSEINDNIDYTELSLRGETKRQYVKHGYAIVEYSGVKTTYN